MSWLSKLHNKAEIGPIGKMHKKFMGKITGSSKSNKSSKSSKKKKKDKHESSGGGEGGGGNRSAVEETKDALAAARIAYPGMLELQKKYDGQFAKVEVDTAETRGKGELSAINRIGSGYEDALKASSPEIRGSAELMQNELDAAGPSEIETELNKQALQGLHEGGNLSADETRQVEQGSREGWAARGLVNSTGSAVAEVMARAGAARGRMRDNQSFAAGVEAQTQQRETSDRGFAINALNTSVANFDPQTRMFGHGGSASTGLVQGTAALQPYSQLADSAAAGNQQEAIAAANRDSAERMQKLGLKQDSYQFGVNRIDSLSMNDANNAAAKKAGQTQAIAAVGGAVVMGLVIF